MPVRNAVSAADIMMPPTFARFSGRAASSDGGRGRGQAPHLEEIAAGHVAGGRIAGDEARDFALHYLAGAGIDEVARLEEERHVPDVVQAERNQRALDDAVDRECQRRLSMHRPIREGLDRAADRRPDEAENRGRGDDRKSGDDRHRSLAGEKAEIARQLDLIESVEGRRRDEAQR